MKIKLYSTIIFPVVLCGCETCCLTLEHKLRVFKNRVLRKIFGHKREEVRGDWRKLFTEDLHDLYLSPDVTQVIISRGWDGRSILHALGRGKLCRFRDGKHERRTPLGRS
jgi:hypothetical protein